MRSIAWYCSCISYRLQLCYGPEVFTCLVFRFSGTQHICPNHKCLPLVTLGHGGLGRSATAVLKWLHQLRCVSDAKVIVDWGSQFVMPITGAFFDPKSIGGKRCRHRSMDDYLRIFNSECFAKFCLQLPCFTIPCFGHACKIMALATENTHFIFGSHGNGQLVIVELYNLV